MATPKRSGSGGRQRAEPGTRGTGNYYRIVVRPKTQFVAFRTQDVGDPSGLQRVAGQRSSGAWSTQAWLVSKQDAHVTNNRLVGDSKNARQLLAALGAKPVRAEGDVFKTGARAQRKR